MPKLGQKLIKIQNHTGGIWEKSSKQKTYESKLESKNQKQERGMKVECNRLFDNSREKEMKSREEENAFNYEIDGAD